MLSDYKGASLLFVNVLYILLPLMMALLTLLHDFKWHAVDATVQILSNEATSLKSLLKCQNIFKPLTN